MMTAQPTARFWTLLLTLHALVLLPAPAATTKLILDVKSDPPGASILVNGKHVGVTPADGERMAVKDVELNDKTENIITAEKDGYAPVQERIFYSVESKSGGRINGSFSKKNLRLDLPTMTEIRREVPVIITNNVAGSTVSIDGKEAGRTPLPTNVVFLRADATTPWRPVSIRIEMPPQYKAGELMLRAEDFPRPDGPSAKPHEVGLALLEIQRTFQLEVVANESDAIIELDDKEIGRTSPTPFRHMLVFKGDGTAQGWPTQTLKVHKKDWEYREPGKLLGKPAFAQPLTVESVAAGTNAGKGVFTVRVTLANPTHYDTPIRFFEVAGGKLKLVVTNSVSESNNKDGDRNAPAIFRSDLVKESLILSRMAFLPPQPDGKDHILYVQPKWEVPLAAGEAPAKPQLVSANLFEATDQTKAPIRTENSVDTDPFVTQDGSWLYYSSDRSTGVRHLWRVSLKGQVGVAKITQDDSYIHLEPAISPDGQSLAYSARPANAPANVPFSIWLAGEDGSNRREIREGRNPAWANDGKRLAYVHQNKIFIMNADGSGSKEITSESEARVLYPVWAPGDRYIYYCSDVAKDKAGNRQFDIWRIHTEKASEPLQVTSNDSLDYAPLIVGKRLYFFSNRGATSSGMEALRICHMDLPPD